MYTFLAVPWVMFLAKLCKPAPAPPPNWFHIKRRRRKAKLVYRRASRHSIHTVPLV